MKKNDKDKDDNDEECIITRKKSNTLNINLIPKDGDLNINDFYRSLRANEPCESKIKIKNKNEHRGSFDSNNKSNDKSCDKSNDKIYDKSNDKINDKSNDLENDIIDEGTLSSGIDKTKSIEILLSEPDLIEKKTVFKIILNLLIINTGISSLHLSKKMAYISIYIYPLLIILIGLISKWTLNIIFKASSKYKKKSYEGIIKEILIRPIIPIYLLLLILTYLGNIILEEIVLYYLVNDIIIKFLSEMPEFLIDTKGKYCILYGIALFILFPLFQLKNFQIFFFIEIILLFIVLLIVLGNFTLFFIYNFDIELFKNKFSINIDYFWYPKNEFFNSIVALFFAFSYHDIFCQFLEKIKNPPSKAIKTIIKSTIIIDLIIYLLFAIIGFLCIPFDIMKDLIIFDSNEIEGKYTYGKWLMTTGRIIFFIYLIFKLFKDYQNLSQILLNKIFCCSINKQGKVINLIISLIVLILTTLLVIQFLHISESICLIGAFCSVYISFIIPLIIYMKENDFSMYHWKNILTFFFICILFLISLSSIFFTITKMLSFHDY